MDSMSDTNEIGGSNDLQELLEKLVGRVTTEVYVVDGRTGERSLMISFDFDFRDSVDVVFDTSKSGVIEGGVPAEGGCYTFAFMDRPGEEVEEMRGSSKRFPDLNELERQLSEKLSEQLDRESDRQELTAEDYYSDLSVELRALPQYERWIVLSQEMDNLTELFNSLGVKPKNDRPSFITRVWKKRSS